MPVKDLREKYGDVKKTRALMNRAIRAECPGADSLLKALDFASRRKSAAPEWSMIYKMLCDARGAMTADVAKRYDFKSETETNEQNQTP